MKNKKILGPIILVSAAMIWGLSFVFQKEGVEYIDTFTFNGIRTLLGAVFLLPVILFRKKKASPVKKITKEQKKKKLLGITVVGLCLFVSLSFQQEAFNYIDPGKIGFITALYMLAVPLLELILFRKKPPLNVWAGVFLGLGGLYLLCVGKGVDMHIGKGEIFTLICAAVFGLHIILIDYFADDIDSIELSFGQFFVTGVLSVICMFLFEKPEWSGIVKAGVPLLYAGVMSCGVAFTFQVVGQKYTEPTLASMLLCLESVFSVLFSLIILHTEMLPREYIGCVIMFIAIIIAQIPKKTPAEQRAVN